MTAGVTDRVERERRMSVFDEHREALEDHEMMMGRHRGRLAVTLNLVTNAMTLVGRHSVYCHRDPEKPTLDVEIIMHELGKAKELVQRVMEELRAERDSQ